MWYMWVTNLNGKKDTCCITQLCIVSIIHESTLPLGTLLLDILPLAKQKIGFWEAENWLLRSQKMEYKVGGPPINWLLRSQFFKHFCPEILPRDFAQRFCPVAKKTNSKKNLKNWTKNVFGPFLTNFFFFWLLSFYNFFFLRLCLSFFFEFSVLRKIGKSS